MEDKLKTLLIEADDFHAPVRLKDHHHKAPQIIVIDDELPVIEINGVKYQERPQPKPRGRFSKLEMMATMFSGISMYGSSQSVPRRRPQVNIVAEFTLIQEKKSTLSRNDRDWVCGQFKSQYKKI